MCYNEESKSVGAAINRELAKERMKILLESLVNLREGWN